MSPPRRGHTVVCWRDTDVLVRAGSADWDVAVTWSGLLWGRDPTALSINRRAGLMAAYPHVVGEWTSLPLLEGHTFQPMGEGPLLTFLTFPKGRALEGLPRALAALFPADEPAACKPQLNKPDGLLDQDQDLELDLEVRADEDDEHPLSQPHPNPDPPTWPTPSPQPQSPIAPQVGHRHPPQVGIASASDGGPSIT